MSDHGLRDYREKAFYTNTSEQNSDIFLFGKQFWVVWTIVHPYKNCTHRIYRGWGGVHGEVRKTFSNSFCLTQSSTLRTLFQKMSFHHCSIWTSLALFIYDKIIVMLN